MKNYYDVLGVAVEATFEEIKKAYTLRIKVVHPDRFNPTSEPVEWRQANDMLREINEAYSVLRVETKRLEYDKLMNYPTRTQMDEKISNTQAKNGNPAQSEEYHIKYYLIKDLPQGTFEKLLNRQNYGSTNQFKVDRSFIFWNYSFVALSLLGITLVISNKPHTFWYFTFFLLLSFFFCYFMWQIYKYHSTQLKDALYFTPVNFVVVEYDRIRLWRLQEIQEFKITHKYKDSSYLSSLASFLVPGDKFELTLDSINIANTLSEKLKDWANSINIAINQNDIYYFLSNDDFAGVQPSSKDAIKVYQERVAKQRKKLYTAACLLSVGLAGFTFSYRSNQSLVRNTQNIDEQYPPDRNYPIVKPNYSQELYKQDSDLSPVALPISGIYHKYFNSALEQPVAPLQIITDGDSKLHYFVKITTWYSDETIMTLFIQSGNFVKVEIPIGSYKIKYSTGEQWYGEKYLFGASTNYSQADQKFDFLIQDSQISGYSIQLYPLANGNLRTKSIPSSEF